MRVILIESRTGRVTELSDLSADAVHFAVESGECEQVVTSNGDALLVTSTTPEPAITWGFEYEGVTYYGNGALVGQADGEYTDAITSLDEVKENLGVRF
jgi:hypothetical protein